MTAGSGESDRVFVDLSNVAKDDLLGFSTEHASLARWERLRGVWIRDRGQPAGFTLIADASLPRAMSMADRTRLDHMESTGEAAVVPDADIEVLRRAIDSKGIALSNDRYVDHRRITGAQQAQLVGWVVRGQTIRIQVRSLDRLLSAVISARAHKQELKELGLSEDAPELQYCWFCRDAACPRGLVAVPHLVRGTAMCPTCDAFLDRGEAWDKPIWLKVMHGTSEVARVVLEDGETAFVGRGVGEDVISLADQYDFANDVVALDDRHVELRNEGGLLQVRDNRSARGTAVRRPASGQLNLLSPPMPASAMSFTTVSKGTKIVLGRTPFTVQISGGTG